jgi:polar amino acid transport system substrate-binding protein
MGCFLVKIATFLLAALLSFSSQAQTSTSPQIKWLAGDLPPFIWQQNGIPRGYCYDLIIAMSAQLGRRPDLTFFPWARAVKLADQGPGYGIFPLARTPDRETDYKWLIKLMSVKYTFFAKSSTVRDGSVDVDDIERLRHMRIGYLRGSPIVQNLRAKNFADLIEGRDYQDLIRLLNSGQISAIYAGYPMMNAALDLSGIDVREFRSGASIGAADLYMAASLDLDAAEEARWLAAYESLQRDGTVARLQRQYLERRNR